jgi:hypothetical protein
MAFPIRRTESFIYSASIAYVLEFGAYFIRVYYDNEYVSFVTTPYEEEYLFQLQVKQIGDVMWIVHPKYPPMKLSRTTPVVFDLSEIEFNNGPFQTRNDLIDPFETSPATMSCSATTVGSFGNLVCSAETFKEGHVGCLYQLTHPRTLTTVSGTGDADSSPIYVKGPWRFITRGTWTGVVYIMRNENNAGWEVFRTYSGSSGAEQNVSLSLKEESDNVQYYISSSGASSGLQADLSCDDIYSTGIVRVFSYGTERLCSVEVIKRIESTAATRKWAEGSWSGYRGYPASLTFFEDRCIYAGALSGSDPSFNTSVMYPVIKTANYGS